VVLPVNKAAGQSNSDCFALINSIRLGSIGGVRTCDQAGAGRHHGVCNRQPQ